MERRRRGGRGDTGERRGIYRQDALLLEKEPAGSF
jgi:hypothetical protein